MKCRWEHVALVGLLVAAACTLGVRPERGAQLLQAVRIAATVDRAEQVAPVDGARSAALWMRARTMRRDKPDFQGLVLARLIELGDAGGDAARVRDEVLRDLPAQPAFHAGEPPLMAAYGRYLLARGYTKEAVAALEDGLRRAPAVDGDGVDLRLCLAEGYERLNQPDKAQQLLEALHEAQPDEPTLTCALARHWADHHNRLPEAVRLAGGALAGVRRRALLHPGDAALRVTRAVCLDALGWAQYRLPERDPALLNLREAQRLFDKSPSALNLYHLAEADYDRGQDVDAQRLVEQALRLDPWLEAAKQLQERLQDAPHRGKEIS
jgi:tetratricopeptide (TPR) repeat protein